MTRFRPCIDLHQGQVKQIVGGTLSDHGKGLKTNFVASESAEEFAKRYRIDQLEGGHVIQLGPGNREAALSALAAWPGHLQIGGGIDATNAADWLEAGASHVIVTSSLFDSAGHFLESQLEALVTAVGAERLVLDLSCRRTTEGWTVAMNRWQQLTNLPVTHKVLDQLANYCSEFLIHAADVEGLCQGIDEDLVTYLGQWAGIPMTYAGGVKDSCDLQKIETLSQGKMDFTVGSALDLFGGSGIRYSDLLLWNQGIR